MSLTLTLIRQIETFTSQAWPALETDSHNGWLLRYSKGYTSRANSVWPLICEVSPKKETINAMIAHCEQFYAERQRPTIFKLTESSQPPFLDSLLAQRGYDRFNDTLVQTRTYADNPPLSQPDMVTIAAPLADEWFSAYVHLNQISEIHRSTLKQMLILIRDQLLCIHIDKQAVGLGIVHQGQMLIVGIAVDNHYRRRGLGRAIMEMLLALGAKRQLQSSILQVGEMNHGALKLYAQLGFITQYKYWYRKS